MSETRRGPRLSVVLPVHDPELRDLERAIGSLERQTWPFVEVCIADDGSRDPEVRRFLDELVEREGVKLVRLDTSHGIAGGTNAALDLATGDYALFLDHDDELVDDAMSEIVRCLQEHPDADFVYSDHDVIDASGLRLQTCFKPDWSPELLLSYMYVGHVKVVRRTLAQELGGFRPDFEGAADYDFMLRIAERTDRVRHIPKVLYHWRAARGSMALDSDRKTYAFEAGQAALADAVGRRRIAAVAEWPGWAEHARLGVYRLRFSSTSELPVTLLIPTVDETELLRDVVASVEDRTEHSNWSILFLSDERTSEETADFLRSTPHRTLAVSGEGNLAAAFNRGVSASETEHVVLLRPDVLVAARGWLDELLGYARMDGVGAVGAKLLSPDGRIQHAGVTLGVRGLAGHAFGGRLDSFSPLEYGFYAHAARNCAAVTGACMLTRRSIFLEAGGFDEERLPAEWHDVDYCLRLLERGWRVVMNPNAELLSLGDPAPARSDEREARTMIERWGAHIESDPYYNPNLSRLDGGFEVRRMVDERITTADGAEGRPRVPADPTPDLRRVDLASLCLSQDERLRELQARVAELETGSPSEVAQWIASRPLVRRLEGAPHVRRRLTSLRGLKRFPLLARMMRWAGLIQKAGPGPGEAGGA